jgi:hypothetical protein
MRAFMCVGLEGSLRTSVGFVAVFGVVGGDTRSDPDLVHGVAQILSGLPERDGFLSGRAGLDAVEAHRAGDVVEALGLFRQRSDYGDGVGVGIGVGVMRVAHGFGGASISLADCSTFVKQLSAGGGIGCPPARVPGRPALTDPAHGGLPREAR